MTVYSFSSSHFQRPTPCIVSKGKYKSPVSLRKKRLKTLSRPPAVTLDQDVITWWEKIDLRWSVSVSVSWKQYRSEILFLDFQVSYWTWIWNLEEAGFSIAWKFQFQFETRSSIQNSFVMFMFLFSITVFPARFSTHFYSQNHKLRNTTGNGLV